MVLMLLVNFTIYSVELILVSEQVHYIQYSAVVFSFQDFSRTKMSSYRAKSILFYLTHCHIQLKFLTVKGTLS